MGRMMTRSRFIKQLNRNYRVVDAFSGAVTFTPPAGFVFLVDDIGNFLIDDDGAYVVVPE
jgi:hypothetical protein